MKLRRSRGNMGRRAHTLRLRFARPTGDVPDHDRPATRRDCNDIARPRPCPFVGCRHHLYLDINAETGSIKLNFPDLEPWELEHTCSLDVAEMGGLTLDEVGVFMNLTRERIRQIEARALMALGAHSLAEAIS